MHIQAELCHGKHPENGEAGEKEKTALNESGEMHIHLQFAVSIWQKKVQISLPHAWHECVHNSNSFFGVDIKNLVHFL
jgi:hypothetical protein